MIRYAANEKLSFEEYHDFLKRTDLGSQYPAEDFEERVRRTLANHSLAITARGDKNRLIGICFGLTDFAYFLFITDLGVDREHVNQGIGRELMRRITEESGGEQNISVVTVSNSEAYTFYEKVGLQRDACLFWKACTQWSPFIVE